MASTKSLLILFGDGEDGEEEFAHACTINTSQEFTIEASTVDGTEPNCEDMNAPSWVIRSVDTLSAGITGAGTMDPVSYGVLRDKMLAGVAFNVRVVLDVAHDKGGGHFEGRFVMTKLTAAKEGKGYVTSDVGLSSDAEVKWVNKPAPQPPSNG